MIGRLLAHVMNKFEKSCQKVANLFKLRDSEIRKVGNLFSFGAI